MIVSKLMTTTVSTCRPHDSLEVAAGTMWNQDIGCLPVLDDDDRVVGIITDRDACMGAYTQGRPLSGISVDSCMAREIYACSPTDSVQKVEALMKAKQIRRVPVVDAGGGLVGLISMNDVARESARELTQKSPDITADGLVTTLAGICERRPLTVAAE
jgi:CBS domain-containing protein